MPDKKTSTHCLQLEYPCRWLYKLIGADREQLEAAVAALVTDPLASLTPSHSSRTGKYTCLDLETMVADEEARNQLYLALKQHPAVKIVL